jgi:hypothetical protein
MINIHVALLIVAAILFLLSAVGVSSPRINLQSLGLLFLTIAFMLP